MIHVVDHRITNKYLNGRIKYCCKQSDKKTKAVLFIKINTAFCVIIQQQQLYQLQSL